MVGQKSSPCKSPWYKNWFDENYLHLYSHRDRRDARNQVELIIKTVKLSKQWNILDLGCGDGRYLEIFSQLGYNIFGLDLSETLIRIGKKNQAHLNLIVGDKRDIPGFFDLILSLFTSFGYFEDDSENFSVFQAVSNSLNPGGLFWLDFLNPAHVKKTLVPESVSRPLPGYEVGERRRIEAGRVIKDISIRANGESRHYHESVRLFERDDLEDMLSRSGLTVIDAFGDYSSAPWRPDSPRTLLISRRTA